MYCYFGHHKCGIGWIIKIIKDLFNIVGWRQTVIYDVAVTRMLK